MFDPKQITSSIVGYAPQFVLSRFSSVIIGVIVAYGVLLTFLGHPPFFQRIAEIGLLMTVCYWTARGVRVSLTRIIVAIEGPDAAPAAAAVADAAPPAARSVSPTSPRPAQLQNKDRDGKGLD